MVEECKTDRLIRDIWTQHTPDQFITIERALANSRVPTACCCGVYTLQHILQCKAGEN